MYYTVIKHDRYLRTRGKFRKQESLHCRPPLVVPLAKLTFITLILKNEIKELGHRACLRVSRLLKWSICTGYALKIRIMHPHRELILGYFKDRKFYLESKTYFIHISSVTSFRPLLIARLQKYCTFSDSSVVSLKSSPSSPPPPPQYGSIFQNEFMFFFPFFFSSLNLFFIRLFSANTWKTSGIPVLIEEKRSIYFANKLSWAKSLGFHNLTLSHISMPLVIIFIFFKIFITNLPNFTEFHLRKRENIHCQFCFLCSCWTS